MLGGSPSPTAGTGGGGSELPSWESECLLPALPLMARPASGVL